MNAALDRSFVSVGETKRIRLIEDEVEPPQRQRNPPPRRPLPRPPVGKQVTVVTVPIPKTIAGVRTVENVILDILTVNIDTRAHLDIEVVINEHLDSLPEDDEERARWAALPTPGLDAFFQVAINAGIVEFPTQNEYEK